MIFGISGTKELSVIERCPYYRGVRKERLHCVNTQKKISYLAMAMYRKYALFKY